MDVGKFTSCQIKIPRLGHSRIYTRDLLEEFVKGCSLSSDQWKVIQYEMGPIFEKKK